MTNFTVIALSGKSGTGKDVITNKYLRPAGYFPISFATHLKIWSVGRGNVSYDDMFYHKPESARAVLQREGTELGRNVYGESIWIDVVFHWMRYWNEMWGLNKFCIMDCRFQNEVAMIQSRGGRVYRINAPHRAAHNKLTPDQRLHSSETDLDNVSPEIFDGWIDNDYGSEESILSQLTTLGLL